jgi:hypothetical protein
MNLPGSTGLPQSGSKSPYRQSLMKAVSVIGSIQGTEVFGEANLRWIKFAGRGEPG